MSSDTKELIIESKKHGTFTVLIDADDWERVSQYKWNVNKNVRNKNKDVYYIITNSKAAPKRGTKLHRYIMNCPDEMVIDHKNQNTLDNRKSNLRICTRADNKRNRGKPSNNTNGYKGVFQTGNKWGARIGSGERSKHRWLGSYDTIEDAARAYDKAAIELHGEFAVLNFPKEDYL